jgi:phage I-like protein
MDKTQIIVALGVKDGKADDASVLAEIKNIVSKVAALEAENQSLKAAAEAAKQAEVKAVIDAAVLEGRATEAERSNLEAIGRASIATLRTTVAMRPAARGAVASLVNLPGGGGDSRASWNLAKWMKDDPEGLRLMEANDPVAFNNLIKRGE